MISGARAYDMALRLQYDDIPIGKIDTNISKALEDFINTNPDEPKQIFCSYTAMTAIRRLLSEKNRRGGNIIMKITIAQLYPRDMNLYGDWGNTLVLKND